MRAALRGAALAIIAAVGSPEAGGAATPAAAEVDRLFADLDRADSPGCALAVVRDGKVAYQRGYGMANLEHRVAISARTVFDIGSTSKQFTAAAIHLLAAEGRLSLDDDVRRWVPELPAYDTGPVSLRHLLHHTSGLRDYLELMDLTGVRFEDVSTDEEALALLSRQKAANFAPGAEWVYSNSGFFLLSIVAKRAGGRSLRDFAAERIFAPLGMRETHFHDDHTMVVPNRATGYERKEAGGFRTSVSNFEQTGDGGVYTTVADLVRWDRNFYEPVVGGRPLLEALLRTGGLRSGEPLKYASGLGVDAHRGLRTVSHGGSWAGYRAELLRFPDQRLSVICLCNVSDARPSRRARQVAELYLADRMAPAATPSPSATDAKLEERAGIYRDPATAGVRRVLFRDGKLWLRAFGSTYELAPAGAAFRIVGAPVEREVFFERTPPGPWRIREEVAGHSFVFEAVAPPTLSSGQRAEYAGEYRSEELDTTYRIAATGDALRLVRKNRPDEILTPVASDELAAGDITVRFQRGPEGRIRGFFLDRGRIRNVSFSRATR